MAKTVISRDAPPAGAPAISQDLRDRLEGLLQTWRKTPTEPPCTIEQLIVIVLLLGEPCRRGAIFPRIITTSGYYAQLASSVVLGHDFYDHESRGERAEIYIGAHKLLFSFNDAFKKLDMPLMALSHETDGFCKYTVSGNDARLMLQPLVEDNSCTSSKPFPFMRLPSELRESMYEMVMMLPWSGVMPLTHGTGLSRRTRLEVVSRDYADQKSIRDAIDMSQRPTAKPIPYYLNLLLVNRQIYEEAVSVFYKRNNFLFESPATMETALRALAIERASHIEHISFEWTSTNRTQAERCFKRLRVLPFLRRLDIYIDEDYWTNNIMGIGQFDVTALHGYNALSSIRGLTSVNFYGDCERTRSALADALIRPKSGDQKKGGKRKAAEVEDKPEVTTSRTTRSKARALSAEVKKGEQLL